MLLQQAFFFRARAECACWPCAKDAVKKGVGPGVDLIVPMMVMPGTYASMFADFQAQNQSLFLRLSLLQQH